MKPVLMKAGACESVLFALALTAQTQSAQTDVTSLQIEDLMNVDVTSVSKKEQKMSSVQAAIFVITQEDIRRSGAINIPDLFPMVPGLDLAQVAPSVCAISARGFNGQNSNKLLVLIDSRFNLYQGLFSREPGATRLETIPQPVHLLMPVVIPNLLYGQAYDIEAFAGVKLDGRSTLRPRYTFLTMHLDRDATSLDVSTGPENEGGIHNQEAQLRSNVNLPWHWRWVTFAGEADWCGQLASSVHYPRRLISEGAGGHASRQSNRESDRSNSTSWEATRYAGLAQCSSLTVGETAGFLDACGMIDFLLEDKNSASRRISMQPNRRISKSDRGYWSWLIGWWGKAMGSKA
jgi:hypothetical protein